MPQKIVVNGVGYDSPDAMPADIRRQYERALEAIRESTHDHSGLEQTVTSFPDGTKIEITDTRAHYTVNGKTYDKLEDLPPVLRPLVEKALRGATPGARDEGQTDVRVVTVRSAPRDQRAGGRLLLLLVLAFVAWLVIRLLGR